MQVGAGAFCQLLRRWGLTVLGAQGSALAAGGEVAAAQSWCCPCATAFTRLGLSPALCTCLLEHIE